MGRPGAASACSRATRGASLRSALSGDEGDRHRLRRSGPPGRPRGSPDPAVALALDAVATAAEQIDRPDLVWSGRPVAGLQARDTRRVYEELVAGAERSIWISTYAYYDGRQAFRTLAERMDEAPAVQVTLLLNIQRRPGDTTTADGLVVRFAERCWPHDWPGERRPSASYRIFPGRRRPIRASGPQPDPDQARPQADA